MSYPLYITLMLICLFFSAFFSASETAFTSANRVKLKTLASDGNKKAERALNLLNRYDKFLSAVLVGNNLVNIGLSTMATMVFVSMLANTGAKDAAAGIATAVVTVVVLIFGEVTPKTIAKEHPEGFSMAIAPIIQAIMFLFTPITALFTLLRIVINKIVKPRNSEGFTEDEILTMVDEAESEGGIKQDEGDLIRSAIEFIDRTAGEILTPRVDITACSINASNEEVGKIISESGFSRIPVYDGTIDNIVGIVHEKDFYQEVYHTDRGIKDILKPPVFTVESIKISDLLKLLQKSKLHIAIVTDEFGGTQGIVSMEDILEELVGEIWDETDEREEDVVQKSETEFIVRGDADITVLTDLFDLDTDDFDATTVGGLFNELTGKMPKEGATVQYAQLSMAIKKVLRHRIIELDIKVAEPTKEEEKQD